MQSVTITIGAALAGNFLSVFSGGDRQVTKLKQNVAQLDKVFTSLEKRSKSTAKSLGSIVKSIDSLNKATKESVSADRAAERANSSLATSNKALGRSYDDLKKKRIALNLETRKSPLPFSKGAGLETGLGAAAIMAGASGRGGSVFAEHGLAMQGAEGAIVMGKSLIAGAAAAALAIGVTVHEAAKLDTILRKIAVTSHTSLDEIPGFQKALIGLSANDKTAQSTESLANALFLLVSAGRDLKTQAFPSLQTIGKVATAYEADSEDVARTTNTLLDNFLITADQMEHAYDVIGQIEKEGKIKLRDFAAILPTIGGISHLNKITGVGGLADVTSALEVISKQTATPGEAATRLEDLLSSMTQKYTQAAFNAQGIDLEAEIKKGDKAGKTRLRTLVDVVQKYSKGDPFRIGELFRNKEAKDALSALIQFRGEWDKMAKDGLAAHGIIEHDFQQMRGSLENSLRSLKNSFLNVTYVVGMAFAPAIKVLAKVVAFASAHIVKFIQNHMLLAKIVGTVIVALTLLGTVLGGVLLAVGLFSKALLFANARLIALGASLRLAAVEFPALGYALTNLAMVFEGGFFLTMRAFGAWILSTWSTVIVPAVIAGAEYIAYALGALVGFLGTITAPVWAIIGVVVAVVAAIAFVIYKFWNPIKAFFKGIWEGFTEALAPVKDAFMDAIAPLVPVWNELKKALGEVWQGIKNIFAPLTESSALTKAFHDAGKALGAVLAGPVKDGLMIVVGGLKLIVAALTKVIELAREAQAYLPSVMKPDVPVDSNAPPPTVGDTVKAATKEAIGTAALMAIPGGSTILQTASLFSFLRAEGQSSPEDTKFNNEQSSLMNDQAAIKDGGSTQHNNQKIEVYVNHSNSTPEQIGDGVKQGIRDANNESARDLRGAHK